VCLKTIMDPPIFLCTGGHGLCLNCREDIKNRGQPCPVCRDPLSNTRNLQVERMLDKLPKNNCKYEACQFKKAELDLVKTHEIDCLYRLVTCGECDKGIALLSLTDHLTFVHQMKPTDLQLGVEKDFNCSPSTFNRKHQPLRCNGIDFYFNQRSQSENLAMFWISFSGRQDEANKYEYILKIQSSDPQPDYLFTGSRRCVSCEVSQEDMLREMTALMIDKKLLVSATVGNVENRIRYTLMIKKRYNYFGMKPRKPQLALRPIESPPPFPPILGGFPR